MVCSLCVVLYRGWFGGGFLLCTLRSTKREIHPREEVVVLLSNSRSSVINLQLMKGQRTELCVLVSPSCGETFGTWNSEHIPHILSFEKPHIQFALWCYK